MNNQFESFYDLGKSNELELQISHDIFIRLLDNLFGKHDGHVTIDGSCETEENQKLIKDHWKIISVYFKLPIRK